MRQHFTKAIELFGETLCPSLCGFILPDGTMLDFSYEGRQRDRDHRDISEVWYELSEHKECPDGTDAMIQFEHMGAVRYSQYGDGVSVSLNTYHWPTWAQWDRIRENGTDCEVAFDVYDRSESRVHSEVIDYTWGNWISKLKEALEEAKENENK
ncbi:MAG: hypothetical protein ACXABY_25370 [Candidatus Thorarchaeota archaeon]|jgi:hypothetical protein